MARVRRRPGLRRYGGGRTRHCAPHHEHSMMADLTSQHVTSNGHSLEQIRSKTEEIPAGYIFVPKGDPYITRHCRLKTSKGGQIIYTVYDAAHNLTLGLYVPATIACMVYAQNEATKDERAQAVMKQDIAIERKNRALLMKAYPFMPTGDLLRILSHAFMKGSRRVGRSNKVRGGELVKMRLAVEAHIRHTHTQYESLLRSKVPRDAAREIVAREMRRIRDEWAGLRDKSIGKNKEEGKNETKVEKKEKKEEDEIQELACKPCKPEVIVIDSSSSDSDLEILLN